MVQEVPGAHGFECPQCGKIFATRQQLDDHNQRGGPPPTVRAR